MEKLKIKGQWTDLKKQVKNMYPNLTEEDLKYTEGREEDLIERLVDKTGKERDELVQWINHLSPQRPRN